MRGWTLGVILVAFAACGGSAPDDVGDDGALIAIDEGAPPVTRQVVSAARTWAPDAPWASVDDTGVLTIAPDCSVVKGTSGPPRLFSLDDADDGRTLVVQVSPSGSGACLPRVLACVHNAAETECADGFQDQTSGEHEDSLLHTGFCPAGACGAPTGDEVIELQLFDRDEQDTGVSARITTDAPITFDSMMGNGSPDNFTALTGHLFDAEITGDFLVSYEIARDHDSSQRLGTGSYHLLWEGGAKGLGIEGQYCTSPTSCKVHHNPTRSPDGQQCVSSDSQPIALGVRIWATAGQATNGFDTLVVSGSVLGGTDPLIFHSFTDAGIGRIELPLTGEGERSLFIEVPVGSFDKRVRLEAKSCNPPDCAGLPDGNPPDVATEIVLRRTMQECN